MIEPSNAELSELPDCSRQYITDLEAEIERLREENALLHLYYKDWRQGRGRAG